MNHEAADGDDQTMRAPSREGERMPLQDSRRSSGSSSATGRNTNASEVEEDTNYLKSPYWWAGITLMVTGEAGNFLAYVSMALL